MKPGKGVVKDSQHIDPGESDGHLRWALKVTWPMLLSAFRQVQPNDSIFVLLLSALSKDFVQMQPAHTCQWVELF
jgi:hypothetical protein